MKKTIRLYDFSLFYAITVILAYLCLITVLTGVAANATTPLLYLIPVALLVLSFVALFWYFAGNPAVLDQSGARKGKLTIPKQSLGCEVFYHLRYREMCIRLYSSQSPDAGEICVQATKRNLKLLEEYLGHALELPEKPSKQGK